MSKNYGWLVLVGAIKFLMVSFAVFCFGMSLKVTYLQWISYGLGNVISLNDLTSDQLNILFPITITFITSVVLMFAFTTLPKCDFGSLGNKGEDQIASSIVWYSICYLILSIIFGCIVFAILYLKLDRGFYASLISGVIFAYVLTLLLTFFIGIWVDYPGDPIKKKGSKVRIRATSWLFDKYPNMGILVEDILPDNETIRVNFSEGVGVGVYIDRKELEFIP